MTIKQKQWQLYYLGYYGGKTDGIWGEKSKAAAVRFQKDYALDADGIFGPLTIAKSTQWQRENGLTPDGIAGNLTRGKILKLPTPEIGDWWSCVFVHVHAAAKNDQNFIRCFRSELCEAFLTV